MNCPHCGANPLTLAPPIKCVTDRTPRLDALFASNEPPLDTDAPMLQQKLAQARAESAALDICIAAARTALEGLLAQKAIVDGYAEQIKNISRTMRTLPTDILGEIFSSFVGEVMSATFDDFSGGLFVDSLDVREGPCVLTHISSRWRRTALDLPRLWSRIQLNLDRYDHHSARASFLQNILSRCSNVPLHITLYMSYDISDYEELSVLLRTSNRWQFAALSVSYSTFVALNSRITLDTVQTVWIAVDGDHASKDQIRILEHAPHLQTLAVLNVSEILSDFTVAWSQITHFTGHWIKSLNTFYTLFSKAVNLRHASFPEEFHSYIGIEHDAQRSMSNITRLDVGYDEVGQKILNNVDFPRLEVLHFANEHVEFPKALRPATRSAIQKLSAYATFRNSEALIAFLSTVPNLGTLELHGWDYEVGLVCMAVLAIDRPVLAPQLHTLRIWDVQVTERLVEMIKARRSSSSTLGIAMLRRIVIDCQPSKVICSDATNGLEELVREGLEVQWCDRGS